jgi:hypothetical protein
VNVALGPIVPCLFLCGSFYDPTSIYTGGFQHGGRAPLGGGGGVEVMRNNKFVMPNSAETIPFNNFLHKKSLEAVTIVNPSMDKYVFRDNNKCETESKERDRSKK